MILDLCHFKYHHQLLVPLGECAKLPVQLEKQFLLTTDMKASYFLCKGHGSLRFCVWILSL